MFQIFYQHPHQSHSTLRRLEQLAVSTPFYSRDSAREALKAMAATGEWADVNLVILPAV